MALETMNFINDFTLTNPVATDAKSQGDDHLRGIKTAVKAVFPGMAGAAWRISAKSGSYTVVANDNTVWFNCTAALTLTLTAVATLGNQHTFGVIANGGDVTIDPNSSETINGATTLVIPNGSSALVVSNGSLFFAMILDRAGKGLTTGITAGSTQTQAGAAAITEEVAHVTASGTDGDGVALPFAFAGRHQWVINADAAQTIQIWPGASFSDAIDGGSANAVDSNVLAFGASRLYIAYDATNWTTVFNSVPTSVGTLTALTVDDINLNGKVIVMTGDTSDTATFTAATNGALSIVTVDAAAAAANIQITADGTVDIDSAGVLTLDSGAAINIEPASGSAVLIDGTISVDAGVVTGATSITSTAFVGDVTGDVTGSAATVTTAAQSAITSLGTLTALTVDDIAVNTKSIVMTGDTDDTVTMTAAANGAFSITTVDDAAAAGHITFTADGNIQATAAGTVDIDSGGILTLDSGAAINIEPASGSAVLIDGTLSIDAGVVTGATSITSTAFTIGSTAITATAAEINLIDGGTSRGTTAVASGDGILINDAGTMAMTNVDTVSTYFAGHSVGGTNIVTTGALDAGSITSNFGTINTGSSAITTTGAVTGGSLVIGSANIIEAELEALDALARGSIIYGNASAATATLTKGSANTVLTSDGTDISWAAAAGGGAAQNLIINGGMTVAQRPSTAITASAYGAVDQWKIHLAASAGRLTVTQDSTAGSAVPLGHGFSIKMDCTTAEGSLAASDVITLRHRIEAQTLQHLQYGNANSQDLTLSFWMSSPKSGTHCVTLNQPDQSSKHYISEFTVASADTWEHFELTIPGDDSGLINNDVGAGLDINFPLVCGSTFQNTKDAWAAGEDYGTSSVQNLLDNTSNNIYVTGVQLEVGDSASDFVHEDIATTMDKCERHCEIWGRQAQYTRLCAGTSISTSVIYAGMFWRTKKRGAPTLAMFGDAPAIYANVYDGGSSGNVLNTVSYAGTESAMLELTEGASMTAGNSVLVATLNADTDYLVISAEL